MMMCRCIVDIGFIFINNYIIIIYVISDWVRIWEIICWENNIVIFFVVIEKFSMVCIFDFFGCIINYNIVIIDS